MRKHFAWNPRLFLGTHDFLFGTHDFFLRTHDFFLGTHDFLPTTHDFLPTTHDFLPTTHDFLPTTHDILPTTHDPRLLASPPEHARSQVKGGHGSGEIELIQACDWLTADNTLDFQREFYINKVFGISRRKCYTFYTEID